jgi:RNA polymerase sigma-70 factor (ECF subfamily)
MLTTPDIPECVLMNAAVLSSERAGLASRDICLAMKEPKRAGSAGLSKGDAERFRAIVDAHFDFTWRSLRGLGVPPASIDDAAQKVFLATAQKLSSIVVGSERAFLFATARGIAANARRAQQRSFELIDEAALVVHPDAGPDPEEALATRQAREVLDRILDGLSEDVRVVFVLYELEGQTMAEIAALLGTPMGTVASRLRRGREEFQSAARRFQTAWGEKK